MSLPVLDPAVTEALAAFGLLTLNGLVPFPRGLVCIAAGAALGWASLFPTMIGSALGAALGFALARFARHRFLGSSMARRGRIGFLLSTVEAEGWRVVLPLRLASPVPGPAINLACGASRMGFGEFIAATMLGLLPQTLLYLALGVTGTEALADPSPWSLTGVVAAFGVTSTALALWRMKAAAHRRTAGLPARSGGSTS